MGSGAERGSGLTHPQFHPSTHRPPWTGEKVADPAPLLLLQRNLAFVWGGGVSCGTAAKSYGFPILEGCPPKCVHASSSSPSAGISWFPPPRCVPVVPSSLCHFPAAHLGLSWSKTGVSNLGKNLSLVDLNSQLWELKSTSPKVAKIGRPWSKISHSSARKGGSLPGTILTIF